MESPGRQRAVDLCTNIKDALRKSPVPLTLKKKMMDLLGECPEKIEDLPEDYESASLGKQIHPITEMYYRATGAQLTKRYV